MQKPFLKKLWSASPQSIVNAIRRRVEKRTAKPRWFRVEAGPLKGAEICLESDKGGFGEMAQGRFDAFIYEALRSGNSLDGATCWDVGAHFGYHSLGFAALGANVVAFEPNRHNASRLEMNLERNVALASRIRLLRLALSDTDGETVFLQSDDLGGSSSGSHLQSATTPLAPESYASFEREMVQSARMDTLVNAGGQRAPDVIKIDVEGGELLVLQGGRAFLKRRKPLLLVEVHHICLMFQVQEFLCGLGYQIKLLDEKNATSSRAFLMAT